MNNINGLPPFKRLCVTIGNLPSSYVDSMSYYECLLWLINYLQKTVIPAINENAEAVKEIQDWIKNLDLQDEVDNKLDEMAESGQLQEIISEYLNSTAVFGFDTVADMKSATNLINGSYAKTLGYYSKNDGGAGLYKIRTVTNEDTEDDAFIIPLNNESLIAELIIDNEVNIKQLGARNEDIEGNKYDIKPYITKYLNRLELLKDRITLYIPSGVWYATETELYSSKGFNIRGDKSFSSINNSNGTIISSFNSNQSYIIKIGKDNQLLSNFVFENISIVNSDFTYQNGNFVATNIKQADRLLYIVNSEFGITDNIFLWNNNGKALEITSSWEIDFNYINVRRISNPENAIINFANALTSFNPNANITACNFRYIMVENVLGNIFNIEQNARFSNNHFGTINFEPYYNLPESGYTRNVLEFDQADNFNDNTAVHWSLFNLVGSLTSSDINNIEINNLTNYYYSKNNINYIYDILFNSEGNYNGLFFNVNNITIVGMNKNGTLLKNTENHRVYIRSCVNFNNIVIDVNERFLKLDIINFPQIIVNNYNFRPRLDSEYVGSLPFYYAMQPIENNSVGFLESDTESLTKNKVIVRPPNNQTEPFARFITSGTKFWFRAKIGSGVWKEFWLVDKNDSSKYAGKNCQGTGNYEWYFIDISQVFTTPTEVYLRNKASVNLTTAFDTYYFE